MSTEKKQRDWNLADTLHSSAIQLLRRLRIQDTASGIGPAKLSALSVLVFAGRPLSLAELADSEQVKNPTMSRLISAMEEDGLVRITPSREDARSIQIRPTDRGRTLLLAGKKRRVDSLANALGSCNQAELDRLNDAIEILKQVIRRL